MSVENVKYITRKPKEGKIFITSACSNVFPKIYYKWEFMENETDYHKKELAIMRGINGGGLVLNDSCYEWNYALIRANKELYGSEYTWELYEDTNINCTMYCLGHLISDNYIPITEEDLKNGDYEVNYKGKDYTLYYKVEEYKKLKSRANENLEEYYRVFMKYFNEKIEGKYYLYNKKYGNIVPKGNKGSFYYNINDNLLEFYDYKKAYCLASIIGGDTEIKLA